MSSLTRRILLAGAAALALGGNALAQGFPTGPVKIINSVGAGGGPDVLTRILDALTSQKPQGLDDARRVLAPLRDAWHAIATATATPVAPAAP